MAFDDPKYTFLVDWWDTQAELTRRYQLSFFPRDNSVEMYDVKNKRPFLRRAQCPTVAMSDLYIGSSVTVAARRLILVDYADVVTRTQFERSTSKSIILLSGAVYESFGIFLSEVTRLKLVVNRLEMVQLDLSTAARFLKASDVSIDDSVTGELCSSPALVLEVVGEDALKKVEHLVVGIYADMINRHVFFSQSSLQWSNQGKELFDENKLLSSSATYNNCSCLVVKPHAINQLGDIWTKLLENGFEISAASAFRLDKIASEEFFEVYRNVLPEYSNVVEHVASGVSVALEIRQKDAVKSLRAFAGPYDPAIAKALRPTTLRALYGIDRSKNGVHVTDLEEDGTLECEYFFKILRNSAQHPAPKPQPFAVASTVTLN